MASLADWHDGFGQAERHREHLDEYLGHPSFFADDEYTPEATRTAPPQGGNGTHASHADDDSAASESAVRVTCGAGTSGKDGAPALSADNQGGALHQASPSDLSSASSFSDVLAYFVAEVGEINRRLDALESPS